MKNRKVKYISTRLVSNKSRIAFKEGAKKAMNHNGYVIIAENGWVVKKHSNGEIVKLERLENNQNLELVLD